MPKFMSHLAPAPATLNVTILYSTHCLNIPILVPHGPHRVPMPGQAMLTHDYHTHYMQGRQGNNDELVSRQDDSFEHGHGMTSE